MKGGRERGSQVEGREGGGGEGILCSLLGVASQTLLMPLLVLFKISRIQPRLDLAVSFYELINKLEASL